jgi:hypothetical protein
LRLIVVDALEMTALLQANNHLSLTMYTSKIDAPRGKQRKSVAIIQSKDLGFPLEGSGERWEVHLNDAFKNALGATITGSSQRPKPRVFTWICYTKPTSISPYIGVTK